ncbi:aminotransferase class III-fold pyridoxal phosphate-dependent enzyme [Tepidimonas sp.]|uniref:aminotransferase class III-fold pyridoxal phosphate-dependent enzyme n=1 Tax=Tepidimonas sp. TaxID=2002775 RepID=UPI0028CF4D90|nr:aminotransferase class III-fold pyridoxal phosphate-dependent enzyme [Tepidimonas sp.]MDT7928795.1 aminotransferase class III-fold pyridoxal phosphate-dependent enzyme [Tepidimonas sp.]
MIEWTWWPALVTAAGLPWGWRRLQLSRAKHPSLAGHVRMAKRVARALPAYQWQAPQAFALDGAPPPIVQQRQAAWQALGERLRERAPRTLALTAQARDGMPDLRLTGRYRVPYPFAELARELPIGAFWARSDGPWLVDLDDNRYFDLTGSYGVNLLGLDAYKALTQQGVEIGAELGPVLGGLHPCVADNVARLKAISGMDDVTFHMSGTEAVMQAVRLARYHTGRRYVVRFAGAYHGWWEDVQPGPGNPMPPRETYTLADMSEHTLRVIRTRRDIACVLVNPLQALHPNRAAPSDSTLATGTRQAGVDRAAYTAWLQALRQACTDAGVALIFDEVFVGFRLAMGGAQAYFGVPADLVCYGKTLGGGLPVGVVCGRRRWMERWRPERPADLCFARGTFNAHPAVMGAMNAFLRVLDTPEVSRLYEGLDERWRHWEARFNEALRAADLPVRVAALSSIWTLTYHQPGRYHWLLQYYLRDEGLALSWVGTGRWIFPLTTRDEELEEVLQRLLRACRRMRDDGWWWRDPELDDAAWARRIRRGLLRETVRAWLRRPPAQP